MALKYRWSLIISTISAMLVALLWGANIGGIYPIIEVVIQQNSLRDYVAERIAITGEAIEKYDQDIEQLQKRLAICPADEADDVRRQIALKQDLADAEQQKADWFRHVQPAVVRWTPADPFQTLLLVFAVLFIGTLLRCLLLAVNMYLVGRIGQRTILDIQDHVFRNTMNMEVHELDVRGTGDLISRIRGETTAIATAITTLFGKTLREPLKMATCLAGAALVNWRLLLFSLIIVPPAVFILLSIARLTKRAHRRAVEESARLLNRLFQAVSYLRLVKAYNMQSHEHQRFRTVATDVYRKAMRISLLNALGRTNNELLGILVISMSGIVAAFLVLNQQTHLLGVRLSSTVMTPSEMILFYAFLVGVTDPLRKMGDVYNLIQSGAVAADRVFPLFDQTPQVTDPAAPREMDPGHTEIAFENVNFQYEANTPVIHQFSLSIPHGSSLAIVGANGCGKSTLINLLLRFFDPKTGAIRIGRHDIRQYRLQDLRAAIGYVTQQTMLFNDTIANNIRYGSPQASFEQVEAAARRAHAHEFISQLELQYDSSIGEHGGKLSGGQRQRLALARAILKDPPILILDEATSQIDPESETLIHESLAEFMQDRTTVLVTHRLSTLDLADRILVMSQGCVVDCGTHDELMTRCAAYRRLRATQLKEAA